MKVGLESHQHEAGDCYTSRIAGRASISPCGDPRCREAVIGERIYNHGDMANEPHWGVITRAIPASKWSGEQVEITPDLAHLHQPYIIDAMMIQDVFKGHSGTRIVTEAAYKTYRDAQLAALRH